MFIFSKLGKYGRLGNQLFQIAATIGLAKKHGVDYGFPEWEYSKYFQNTLPGYPGGLEAEKVVEPNFNYTDIILDQGRDIDLAGYFQSEKYFDSVKRYIKDQFSFDQYIYPDLFLKNKIKDSITRICAIHVRRGDYVGHPDYFQIPLQYYINAIKHIPEGTLFYVFSDDIDWCKKNFKIPNTDFIFIEGNSEIMDFALMKTFDHFIIANSSFSWWAAWLSENNQSVIIAPDRWFSDKFREKNPEHDIVPARWKKVSSEYQKEDLRDVTFTIPVRCEHDDRKNNLELVVCFLQKYFHTNIIIAEQDLTPKLQFMSKFCQYRFFQSGKREFERTKLLNTMAHMAQTPIIVNYDTDVLFDPEQIIAAVKNIRSGEVDGCYPYDGRFVRIDRKNFTELQKTISIEPLINIPIKEHEREQVSYGGAIFWDKESFLQGGMENQNMVSYGPEDYERYDRFTKLGYKVGRVPGVLYHINHFVGPNSSGSNPFFKHNTSEWEKIKSFSPDELKKYVAGWTWSKDTEPAAETIFKPVHRFNDLEFDKIYCVNLERRPDRKQHAIEQFQKAGITGYDFFKAIDGKAEGFQNKGDINPGMIGCFLSHKRILKEALDNNYNMIAVFEDDLLIMPGFQQFMKIALPVIPPDWQFVFLGCQEHSGFGSHKEQVNNFWVVPNCAWGTQAYMIRGNDAIRAIYSKLEKMEMQIDMQLAHIALPESGVRYYSVFPTNVVSQDYANLGTDIQDKNRDPFGKHQEKAPVFLPVDATVKNVLPPDLAELEKSTKAKYGEMAHIHGQLKHMEPEPRKDACLTIVETFSDQLHPAFEKLDHFKKFGKLPEEPFVVKVELTDPVQIIKRIGNLNTYISKANKGKLTKEKLPMWQAEKVELEKKLSTK